MGGQLSQFNWASNTAEFSLLDSKTIKQLSEFTWNSTKSAKLEECMTLNLAINNASPSWRMFISSYIRYLL